MRASAQRRTFGRPLAPEDLFEFDQDHYGGIAAVETLARRAGIRERSNVLDVCAGLGGPARFLAARHSCQVVTVELHAGRAAAAARLTRDVRLASRVHTVRADAVVLPLRTAAFDACISQEGLLHIADKPAALRECHRVLRPGGRLAFTDWVAHRLDDAEREYLGRWMAACTLQSMDGYRELMGRAGFGAVEAEDIAPEWRPVLRARLERHRAEGAHITARFGVAWAEQYHRLFGFFVALVEAGKLGGGRFSGTA